MLALGITQNCFDYLWLMILLVNIIMLLPLPLLKLVPNRNRAEENGYDNV